MRPTTRSRAGSIRTSAAPTGAATQTDPAPTASPPTLRPTRRVALTAFVAGSIRATVPATEFATHTAPAPNAIVVGWPIGIVAVTAPVGARRVTVPSHMFATQTAPAPAVSAVAPSPTSTRETGRAVAGATRHTNPAGSVLQGAPHAARSALGRGVK